MTTNCTAIVMPFMHDSVNKFVCFFVKVFQIIFSCIDLKQIKGNGRLASLGVPLSYACLIASQHDTIVKLRENCIEYC